MMPLVTNADLVTPNDGWATPDADAEGSRRIVCTTEVRDHMALLSVVNDAAWRHM